MPIMTMNSYHGLNGTKEDRVRNAIAALNTRFIVILKTLSVGLLAFGLATVAPAGPARAAGSCSVWNLQSDFKSFPNHANPNPDGCGSPVWTFLGSADLTHSPATYTPMTTHFADLFSIPGLDTWETSAATYPLIGKNTNLVQTGLWPASAVILHPGASSMAVVGWTSPITGTVAVSGSFADIDPVGSGGINWSIDFGSSTVGGNLPEAGSAPFNLPSVAVAVGETIYFTVDPNLNLDHDSTSLELSISNPVTGPQGQTVSFTSSAPTAVVGEPAYTPTATATSGLPVAVTVDPSAASVCSIAAGAVSFQTVGTCVLNASQAGNASYLAAAQVQQSFSVYAQPVFVQASPPITGTVGQSYGYAFQASGTPSPTYTLVAAPSWLTVANGVVSGTPTAGTTSFSYSVVAANLVGQTTAGPFTVAVATPPPLSNKADVSVSLSCAVTGNVGVPTTCTLTVSNKGPAAATDVLTAVELSDKVKNVSMSGGGKVGKEKVSRTVASLAANGTVEFTLTYTPTKAGKLKIEAETSATTPDPKTNNNETSTKQTITN